jgi:outer membrane protein
MKNNIAVKQAEIQTRISQLVLKQSKLSQYPSLSYGLTGSYSSGRNQDPTTFNLITKGYLASSMSLQSGVELFNWYSKRNTIAANDLDVQAAAAGVEKQKNDIALVVANSYLQILLAKAQLRIAEVQLQLSQARLINVRKLVNAGSLPELNAAEIEAQVATDSANVIGAKGNVQQNYLFLKAYMNIDATKPLEIEEPSIGQIPVENIADLQPEIVYARAIKNFPQQRVNQLKFLSAQKTAEAAKGAMMPTISMYGSLGSRYTNQAQNISGVTYYTPTTAIGKVSVNGISYDVLPAQAVPSYSFSKPSVFNQFGDNFNQSIGLSINVPIFNGATLRTNYERSKINIESVQLQRDQDDQKLKQDIYQAYNAAVVAREKFNASAKSVETAQRSFDFASKRYNIGFLTTIELVTIQNNLYTAKLQYALNQFDFVFKMKVLEYYKGEGLKL